MAASNDDHASTCTLLPFPWSITDDDVIEMAPSVDHTSQGVIEGLLFGNECDIPHIVPVVRLKEEPVYVLSVDFEYWIRPDINNYLWASALDHIVHTDVGLTGDCPFSNLQFVIYHQSQVNAIPATSNDYITLLCKRKAPTWYGSILVMVKDAGGRFIPFKSDYTEYARLAVMNMVWSLSLAELQDSAESLP